MHKLQQDHIAPFNTSTLEGLVECFNKDELTELVLSYEKKKQSFLKQTSVRDFHHAVVSRVESVLPKGKAFVTITVSEKWASKRTLKDIEELAKEGFKNCYKSFVEFHAKPGSINISWVFPEAFSDQLEQLARINAAIFKKAGVEKVTIGERRVYPADTQQVQKVIPTFTQDVSEEKKSALKQVYAEFYHQLVDAVSDPLTCQSLIAQLHSTTLISQEKIAQLSFADGHTSGSDVLEVLGVDEEPYLLTVLMETMVKVKQLQTLAELMTARLSGLQLGKTTDAERVNKISQLEERIKQLEEELTRLQQDESHVITKNEKVPRPLQVDKEQNDDIHYGLTEHNTVVTDDMLLNWRTTDPSTPLFHQRVVPFQFTFHWYKSRSKYISPVKKSQSPYIGIDESLKSHPFYTHEYGYKMCIGVAPQGVFEGKGTHLSLYAYLMKGDYDSDLPWPFRGKVYLLLINQLNPNEGHYKQGDPIVFDNTIPSMCCARVTMGDYSPHGWANCKFISNVKLHYDQDKKTQYLKDDTIIIRVNAVTVANKITHIRSQPPLPPTMSTINTPKKQRIVPYEFTMNYIEKCKADEPWFSSEFYSHKSGYLMCVEVVPTGKDTGKGTHLSVYIHLMKGDYDDGLAWPFQGKVTIQLVNQEADEKHRELLIYFTEDLPDMYCERVTGGDCSHNGWGTDVLISRSALERDEEDSEKFMKDGMIKFRVINVTLIETCQLQM